ncbi:tRNA (adenosine(37)-N6)-threonylcarbamoyltransferase complex ATPase subunit type 1 TsaE [Streptomyces sp. 35G-GA-8]|uniref:tRNA (adenosine(37)-N6)-threonylcarbamoyltransferase complex ATPase subunit type 1 TsaE n=1 Tax=Streptomyces sp. 35G-GA-8 TaxID=2939434 RepID=UPI00201F6EAA|nr:tRNA (adenosine(37)-N6)-threonylcarbamoyltransferase complex ATPase subunit type 1 TsaE [Streptomyces sp. 35G-GA-8]MCL7376287.1 tRNA (adenosine(37)-N6)-threonylcarbamoyltransferase complex ATPase subunit type 1 TsaE [Streptomyces sp. 35G-GA-8]
MEAPQGPAAEAAPAPRRTDRPDRTDSPDRPAVRLTVETPERMRELGRGLAALLRPGDLVMLTGELGAGKTTLTRGLGEGLGVRGAVTSPTFVIARVHPSLVGGPPLVHVDAYRLGGGLDEMEDLDLDVSLPDSVVVVEWGDGKVEELSDDRLHVVIHRTVGADRTLDGDANAETNTETNADANVDTGADPGDAGADERRVVTVTGFGSRWSDADLAALIH